MDVATTLGGTAQPDGTWKFELEERFNGAFGGTNGGTLAALSLHVARRATGRRPASIDARFLRGFRPGTARVVPTALSEGRTLSVVGVDVVDDRDRVCTHCVVTLAAPEALAQDIQVAAGLERPSMLPFSEGKVWPDSPKRPIPLIDTFQPTHLGGVEHEVVTGVRVLWDEPGSSAEAACIAADMSVGPPVARAVRGAASTPNPDLSLRFVNQAAPAEHLVAVCSLEGIDAGLATTRIAVWQDQLLLAVGVSTTTCIPLKRDRTMVEYEPGRWIKILFRVKGSVLRRIIWRVLGVTAIACAFTYAKLVLGYELPNSMRLHMVVGVALGLLLVFRTNTSYERFWEGRIQVGEMVNHSRDLARKTAAYLADSPVEVRERVGRYIIALFAATRRSLRRERDTTELAALLTEEERKRLEKSSAPPLIVARWLTDQFQEENRAGRVSDTKLRVFDPSITELVQLWGGAERILKTPVPFAYAHHIKGFLLLFCVTSPLALLDSMGWYAPLGAAVIAYGLFGIDEIGIEIEEPFGHDTNDLPMDGIGETIARNVCDVLELDSRFIPKPQDGKSGIYR